MNRFERMGEILWLTLLLLVVVPVRVVLYFYMLIFLCIIHFFHCINIKYSFQLKALPPGLMDTINTYLGPQQHYAANSAPLYPSQQPYQPFYSTQSQFGQFKPAEEPQKSDDSERGFFENTITKWKTKVRKWPQLEMTFILNEFGVVDSFSLWAKSLLKQYRNS